MKILLIEDDVQLAVNSKVYLEENGILVDHVINGKQGVLKATLYPYSVIVLDWMLPDGSGPDFLRELHTKGIHIPVILTTAKGQIDDRLEGFDAGADDYLVKPYELSELVARISAIVRRSTFGKTKSVIQLGTLEVNLDACSVKNNQIDIPLTPKEYAILEILVHHQNAVVLKSDIIHHVWYDEIDPFTNNLEVHIKNLRQKIDKPFHTTYIKTIKGKGYMISENSA